MMSFSLIPAAAVMLLATLPVARADLQCHIKIDGTDICGWANAHGGLAIACVGAFAALIMFFGFCIYSFRFGNTGKAEPMSPMAFTPSRPPQLPPIYTGSGPYPFEGQGPQQPPPNPYAPQRLQAAPAYAGYAV
ncbi:hypothetical protein BV22DRAFT_1198984 [Leucogyrophana mollusca]|uniref:Uncharacterized protein n=1 Tax=Leucogyrophana mollusca TaxID=85980 RepID=A0ACB8B527_9AGAM|nr:hypothetical protein BV22DRAFT_1198984 [Leucogyrophana mollusca]